MVGATAACFSAVASLPTSKTMQASHISAPTVKPLEGSVACVITREINFNTAGAAAGIKVLTLRGATKKPILIKVFVEIVTAFNAATTNVLTVGTDQASSNQILAAADITEGTPGFYPAAPFVGVKRYSTYQDIWVKYTQSGTAATTGKAILYIEMTPLDPYPNSDQFLN